MILIRRRITTFSYWGLEGPNLKSVASVYIPFHNRGEFLPLNPSPKRGQVRLGLGFQTLLL